MEKLIFNWSLLKNQEDLIKNKLAIVNSFSYAYTYPSKIFSKINDVYLIFEFNQNRKKLEFKDILYKSLYPDTISEISPVHNSIKHIFKSDIENILLLNKNFNYYLYYTVYELSKYYPSIKFSKNTYIIPGKMFILLSLLYLNRKKLKKALLFFRKFEIQKIKEILKNIDDSRKNIENSNAKVYMNSKFSYIKYFPSIYIYNYKYICGYVIQKNYNEENIELIETKDLIVENNSYYDIFLIIRKYYEKLISKLLFEKKYSNLYLEIYSIQDLMFFYIFLSSFISSSKKTKTNIEVE